MTRLGSVPPRDAALARVADYGRSYRSTPRPLHPSEDAEALRKRFCVPMPETGRAPEEVIAALIDAAEPGLVGNTEGGFHAWVMGGSDRVGVAADWLTSLWGQNAAIYQTAPAAAIAEEAVAAWLLDLLDLPRESSVGLVTGATMAGFVGLAAARGEVLRRAGHDFDARGFAGAPEVRVFLSGESHASNLAALRYLGFGREALCEISSDDQGVMRVSSLRDALAAWHGPKIVLAQAGQINTGGSDDFTALADLAQAHGAWLHVDGAFGLWLRVLPEKASAMAGVERADSWSVDGHKWLQLPYDSGFAVVRDAGAHRRAMDISAAYLTCDPRDGRNPTEFNPELSRRARGFAAWAVLQARGRSGLRELIGRHCRLAEGIGAELAQVPGVTVLNRVEANQVIFALQGTDGKNKSAELAARLNAGGSVFLRTTVWKGREVVRVSVISGATGDAEARALVEAIRRAAAELVS